MQKPAALQKVHLAATMDANAFVKVVHYWKGSLSNPVGVTVLFLLVAELPGGWGGGGKIAEAKSIGWLNI